jgi:hypothetical protein
VAPVIKDVELVGPQTVPLDETVQFTLMAHLSDGSSRDVTSEARWSGGWAEGRHVSIAGPGLVTGTARGWAQISADFVTPESVRHHAFTNVIVLPAGTYQLSGRVKEAGSSDGALAGARVEVTTGSGAGQTAVTDWWGYYFLYGVSGETTLRVTKEGYQPATRTLVVADHQAFDMELPLLRPRADVSGTYTLTITAANHCGTGLGEGNLPEEARVRTYTATVRQDGPRLYVTLSGDAGGFDGKVESGYLVFNLAWYDGEAPYVVERLTASTILTVYGSATVTGSANRFAGTFDGRLRVSEGVWSDTIAACNSTSHQFVLAR